MTEAEIYCAWRRFMRAKVRDVPLYVILADSGVDTKGVRDAFFTALQEPEERLEHMLDEWLLSTANTIKQD